MKLLVHEKQEQIIVQKNNLEGFAGRGFRLPGSQIWLETGGLKYLYNFVCWKTGRFGRAFFYGRTLDQRSDQDVKTQNSSKVSSPQFCCGELC